LLDRLLGLGMGRRQRGAHFPFEVAHRAQRDRHAQDRFDELLDTPFAGMQDAAEEGQGRRQPRTAAALTDFVGNLRPVELAAVGAGAGMRLILGHLHRDLGQLDDLMPARLGVVGTGRLRQVVLTGLANVRPVMDRRFGEAVGRQSDAQVSGVPRLAAGFAPRRLFVNGRRRLRRIGRRRHRRVGRILAQPRFEIAKPRLQFGDPLQQLSTASAVRLIHGAMLPTIAFASCASFTR
jgi:hypothetical protein